MWWFVTYWGLLMGLGGLEIALPGRSQAAERDHRWPTNISMGLINAFLAPLAPVSAVLGAQWAHDHGVGLLNVASLPGWLAAGASIVGLSLADYAIHVLLHKLPPLWRLHRVHHMDTSLDVTTSLRNHPLELLVVLFMMFATAIALGPTLWVLIGYEMVHQIINLVSHANLRLPRWLDIPLRLVLVTPNIHCLHHSCHRPETDSNYGSVFTFWDRVFGTFNGEPANGHGELRIGLDEIRDARVSNFWWQIISPALRVDWQWRNSRANGSVNSNIPR